VIGPGDLVALAAAFGWAGSSILARATSRFIPAAWYNALRIAVAAGVLVLLLPWTLARTDPGAVTGTDLALLLGSVFAGFGIGDTAFFESMRRLGVARAMPIAGCHPLVTALLAVGLLGEPVTGALLLGVVVVSVGVWLVTTDSARAGPARGPERRGRCSSASGWP
jgi:drug/metabolite transporter (DMT)-like permease